MFTALVGAALPLLVDAALKATVVLSLAFVLERGLRRNSAAARHLVWTMTAAALLALPVFGLLAAWQVGVGMPGLAAAQPGIGLQKYLIVLQETPRPVAPAGAAQEGVEATSAQPDRGLDTAASPLPERQEPVSSPTGASALIAGWMVFAWFI